MSGNSFRASLSIQLKVVDINDNPPAFSQSAYQATILEAQEVGGPVIQVTAIDPDEGENSRVTYRIENRAETHSDWFDIEPDTGTIKLK
jgi:Cadherin domain